ncbi:MAG: M23 family metallopeptidase [Alphaproteobacteria bacterium]
MLRRLLIVVLLVAGGAVRAESLRLDGPLVQGGLAIGHTLPGTEVRFDGHPIRVSPEGVFLIGFTRDAPPEAELTLRHPDGTARTERLAVAPRSYDIQRIDGLPETMVTPPPEVLARIQRENALIAELRTRDTPATEFLKGWIWPAQGRISGVYGSQRILNGVAKQPHYGVDIAAPVGTPVKAPAGGTVLLAAKDLYYTGGTVILDHGHGLSSAFLHMEKVLVKEGQRLAQGEVLGTLGATGRATGPHLDWRINLFEARIDPALLVPPMPAQ